MIRLGIGSYTYGWATGAYSSDEIAAARTLPYLTSKELVDCACELGVTVLQVCERPSLHLLEEGEIDELARYAQARGVSLELGTTGSDPGHLHRYLELADRLDAHLIRTLFLNPSDHLREETRRLARLAPSLEERGITLAIENHERYASSDLVGLLRAVGSERIGVCLDTVNSLGRGEGVAEVVGALMPYTKCLHVKDFVAIRGKSNMGFEIVGAPTGTGRLDIPAHLAAFRAVCPDGSVILEQWTAYTGNFEESVRIQEEWAREAIEYLRTMVSD